MEWCAEGGEREHPEITLLVCALLVEVGTEAGHGVSGDRCFLSDEL